MYSQREVDEILKKSREGRASASAEAVEKFEKLLRDMGKIEESRPLTPGELMWRTTAESFIEVERRKSGQRPLTLQDFGGGGYTGGRSGDRFASFGEELVAIRNAGLPGGRVDERLYRAATGLGETTPSDGGFLVQTDHSSELLQDVFKTGILAPLCRRIPIGGNANGIKINGVDETSRASTRSGGILGYWKDEAAEKTASKPKFRQIELSLKKLIGLCYSSDELLADAPALESVIRQAFVEEFRFRLDDAILNGTGAGMPLGLLNASCLVTINKESGQTATIVPENLFKMYSRMIAPERAVWLIHPSIQPQLFSMSLAVGTGGIPIYMPAGGVSGLPYQTLFGRPVLQVEQCAPLGTIGDVVFANLQDGYILAEKGGIQSDMSIHTRFVYDESCFRFVLRLDGQPVRASALTPYKGSDTLSHFCALQSRS